MVAGISKKNSITNWYKNFKFLLVATAVNSCRLTGGIFQLIMQTTCLVPRSSFYRMYALKRSSPAMPDTASTGQWRRQSPPHRASFGFPRLLTPPVDTQSQWITLWPKVVRSVSLSLSLSLYTYEYGWGGNSFLAALRINEPTAGSCWRRAHGPLLCT